MSSLLFDGWHGIFRVLIAAPLAYAVLVAAVRLSGKRTLAKMNAFDLVVTVALGSTLASTITSAQLPLAEGLLSLVLLVALQFAVSWTCRRSRHVARAIKSSPQVLFRGGEFLMPALMRERVLESDVLQAVRKHGLSDMTNVEVVLLESDGSFSVLKKVPGGLRQVGG